MEISPLVVKNARVLDVRSGAYAEADLVLENGKITEISPGVREPENARVIDASGKYVLPGLIDCHVHVTALNGDLGSLVSKSQQYVSAHAVRILGEMLARGFTSVRDASGADFGLALAQEEGTVSGPRIFFCGHAISQTGGHGDFRGPAENHAHGAQCCAGIGRVADGVSAVRVAARDELRKGASFIKIMASGGIASPTDRLDSTQYSEDEIRAAVEEAEAANRYVAAHAYTARAVNRCLELGVRSIEHCNYIDESSVALFLEKDAFMVPTLSTHWALVEHGLENGLPHDSWLKAGPVFAQGLEALKLAHESGVKIVYATDLLGGMQTYQNHEFTIRAGVQGNLAVVQGATLLAAELLERTGEIGEVSVGANADLIIVDADPLADIAVLADFEQHRVHVIQGGQVVV